MGLILVPSEVIKKSTSVKTALSNIVSGYQNVLTQVSNFANDEALQSDSWAKLKEKVLEYHTFIEQGMLVVQESVEADLATLEGSIGSETLDEDELVRIIESLENEKKNCEEAIEQWNIQKNSMAIYVVNSSLCSMIERSIEILEKEIENLNELINTYKEKLEFLYTAEDSTKSLFNSAIQLLIALSALISEVGVKIMSANPEVVLPGIDCEIYKNIISKELKIDENEKDIGEFVGYLSYGSDGLSDIETDGFFKLYDAPTLESECEIVDINDLYRKHGLKPYGALQSFTEIYGPNKSGGNEYGNQDFDPKKGTLEYNGIERYAIAMGPKLQNPKLDLTSDFGANDMAYGTCVDISIKLNNQTYYIPAIIVDCKGHSAPTGIFQTGKAFNGGKDQDTGPQGPIVEWYTKQFFNDDPEKNKSAGLNKFSSNAQILFYWDEVLE